MEPQDATEHPASGQQEAVPRLALPQPEREPVLERVELETVLQLRPQPVNARAAQGAETRELETVQWKLWPERENAQVALRAAAIAERPLMAQRNLVPWLVWGEPQELPLDAGLVLVSAQALPPQRRPPHRRAA
jgi:hypothetical protein